MNNTINIPTGFTVKPGDTVYLLGRTRISANTVVGYKSVSGKTRLVVKRTLGATDIVREVALEGLGKTWFTSENDAEQMMNAK